MDPHPHTPQKKKKRKPTETLWSSDLITTSKNSYCRAVETLVDWCKDNHLLLNVSKTKKIVVDFRRDPQLLAHWSSMENKSRSWSKYLGSIIDSKLDWSLYALALLKMGNHGYTSRRGWSPSTSIPCCWKCFTGPW